jgi:hypothetical protein
MDMRIVEPRHGKGSMQIYHLSLGTAKPENLIVAPNAYHQTAFHGDSGYAMWMVGQKRLACKNVSPDIDHVYRRVGRVRPGKYRKWEDGQRH